jgi:hypothetical protein
MFRLHNPDMSRIGSHKMYSSDMVGMIELSNTQEELTAAKFVSALHLHDTS